MGKTYESITPELRAWVARQHMFFVASAPLASEGHVNCSPKGGDSFRILGSREVAYADLTGSGVETISHVQENGRLVVMFCAFEGSPRIVRFHGRARVVYPEDGDFALLAQLFEGLVGLRAIIHLTVDRVGDSCGFSVPLFEHVGERDLLDQWAGRKGDDGLAKYREEKNAASIDGLPGYRPPPAPQE